MTTKFKKSFSPMLICWNDIKIHLGFEDSYFVPPPNSMLRPNECCKCLHFEARYNPACCTKDTRPTQELKFGVVLIV